MTRQLQTIAASSGGDVDPILGKVIYSWRAGWEQLDERCAVNAVAVGNNRSISVKHLTIGLSLNPIWFLKTIEDCFESRPGVRGSAYSEIHGRYVLTLNYELL
jgi:hypothetical protein